PYSLELVEGAPGHRHTAFELARGCSIREAREVLDGAGVEAAESDGSVHLAGPDAAGIELVPARERPPWVAHARRSKDVRPGPPRKLGHVNFLTADLEAGVRFYTAVLRMRGSDRPGTRGGRVAVNSR